jgi:hypothetical protein
MPDCPGDANSYCSSARSSSECAEQVGTFAVDDLVEFVDDPLGEDQSVLVEYDL